MSQNDFVIANQSFPATRADLTSAFQAAASNSSGALAPTTTYANMMWYDTTAKILKIRSEADDAWISIGYLDQGTNTFKILDDTVVTTADGLTAAGLLGDQTTGTWETGTGTTESLVSPAKVKAAIIANSLQQTNLTTNVSGYFTMSNGLIYQWDTWSYSHGTRNFPVAFPNKCLGFGYTQTSGWYENWNASVLSASQFSTSNVMVGTNASRAYNQYMFSIGH